MKYLGKTKLSKLEEEDKADYIEVSDEADAILTEIKTGFERLRVSSLRR